MTGLASLASESALGGVCNYQLLVGWAIPTTESRSWPNPPDTNPEVYESGRTSVIPIPASLNLSGTVTVPAYESDPGRDEGFYGIGSDSFTQQFEILQECHATVASSCVPPGQPDGTATISWNFFQYAGIAFGAIAGVAGALEAPGPAISTGLVSAGLLWASTRAGGIADDPPDPQWRSIFTPQLVGPTRVTANGFLDRTAAAALSAILEEMAKLSGLEQALTVSFDRRSSALAAHSPVFVKRQTDAMGRYAIQSAAAIRTLVSLIQDSKATLSAPLPSFTRGRTSRRQRLASPRTGCRRVSWRSRSGMGCRRRSFSGSGRRSSRAHRCRAMRPRSTAA